MAELAYVESGPRFWGLVPGEVEAQELYDQCTFTEGPVWFGDLSA